ncbi:uncharacterized protein METZ01_LOCUS64767 [marine metagenome]|uniref:Uncharacterized protein n=1 Tax=marine metagenome TaxID=408172 RepID=A0A381TDA8_9ZZZZ
MSHFAKIDENNVVVQVLVVEQDFINTGRLGDPADWIQTSYNTYHGEHVLGGTPLRQNYAGVGYTYDAERDAFLPPKPFASWLLDESIHDWMPPMARPDDGKIYHWNEEIENWSETNEDSGIRPPEQWSRHPDY